MYKHNNKGALVQMECSAWIGLRVVPCKSGRFPQPLEPLEELELLPLELSGLAPNLDGPSEVHAHSCITLRRAMPFSAQTH